MNTIENLSQEQAMIQDIENAIQQNNDELLSSIIKNEMDRSGFIHISNKMSTDLFDKIGNQLGNLLTKTSIKVNKQNEKNAIKARAYRSKDRPITYSAKGINFHSDSPIQNTIGFYCIEQDKVDGSLLMLDMNSVQEHLTPEELSILKTIKVNWGSLIDGKEVLNEACLFNQQKDRIEVYYAPWHLQENLSTEQELVLKRFQNFIKHLHEEHLLKVRLQEGETIFVNNRRMLHSRESIADDSKRHIIRLGIGLAG